MCSTALNNNKSICSRYLQIARLKLLIKRDVHYKNEHCKYYTEIYRLSYVSMYIRLRTLDYMVVMWSYISQAYIHSSICK